MGSRRIVRKPGIPSTQASGAGSGGSVANETDLHDGILLPEAQEQVGLNRLSANVAQAGRDDCDFELAPLRIGRRVHTVSFLKPFFSRSAR